jgi:hypothetical protein
MRADAVEMLRRHRAQLSAWSERIGRWREGRADQSADALDACVDDLLEGDPLLSGFSRLPSDVQGRERFFLRNSVKGYWEYLSRQKS